MTNRITTIQIRENLKNELERFKGDRETYEEVIISLLEIAEKQKREMKELLIEGCKEMAEESLKIIKDWENTDTQLDWEW